MSASGRATRILALASTGLREAVRDKALHVLAGFCVVLIAGSILVSQLTVGERARIVMDLGLSATSVLGTLTAVFVTVNQISRHVEQKSMASILAKPVARWELLVGRYAGVVVLLFLLQAAMSLLHVAVLLAVDGYRAAMWKAEWLGFVESCVVAAIAVMLSSFATILPATFLSLALVVIGHTSWGLKMMADRLTSSVARALLVGLYHALPSLEAFDVRSHVAWEAEIPMSMIAWGTAYGAGCAVVMLALASAFFARRDLA